MTLQLVTHAAIEENDLMNGEGAGVGEARVVSGDLQEHLAPRVLAVFEPRVVAVPDDSVDYRSAKKRPPIVEMAR